MLGVLYEFVYGLCSAVYDLELRFLISVKKYDFVSFSEKNYLKAAVKTLDELKFYKMKLFVND